MRLKPARRNARLNGAKRVRTVSGPFFRGLPRGRVVISRPRVCVAVSDHASSPKGDPWRTLRRSADSSASVSGAFTCSSQPGERRMGHGDRIRCAADVPWLQRYKLLQRQSSARSTRFARRAFRSTYRQTVRKCSSSWTRNDLKRPW